MKKLKVKLPGGGSLEVQEFETDIRDDGTMSAADYRRLHREEEEYDRRLDEFAREIADRMDAAEPADRALEYWQVGRLMLDHKRQLKAKAKEAGLREYEAPGRTRQRLMEKLAEIRKGRGAKKERYSPHYLRKFIRHADLFAEAQAARPVHYSLQHELLYDWLTREDRDAFLERCENGEFKSNVEVRRAVAELARARGIKQEDEEHR